MNIVIIYGEIMSNIDFRFIYDRFKRNNTNKETYSHTSIAKCKMRLINGSIVNVYGYDNVADYMYRNWKEGINCCITGRLDSDESVEIKEVN